MFISRLLRPTAGLLIAFFAIAARAGSQVALRFPVAHMHTLNVCYGYLYVTAEGIRYEAVRPNQRHSFTASRQEVQSAGRWVLLGTPQDVAELRIGRATYRFKVLADTTGVTTSVPGGAPITSPDGLLAAIRDPAAAIALAQGNRASPPDTSGSAGKMAAAAPAPPAPAVSAGPPRPPLPGMLDGAYDALVIGTGGHVDHRFLIFYPDGRVMNGMPEEGLEGFSFAAFAADPKNQNELGRYRVDGEQINIVWEDWPGHRDVVQHREGVDVGYPDVYIPLCRCDGERFSGLYKWDYQSGIEFSLDGGFVDHGVIDQLDVDLGFFNQPRVRRGTYRIHDYSLYLDFQDGQHLKTSFGAPAFQESRHVFNWISIYGYQILHREGYQPPP
jgi:hypothetical protein